MKRLLVVGMGFVCLLSCATTEKHGAFDRAPAFSFFKSEPLSQQDILDASSSGPLKASKVRVMTDNDASFDSKLEAIRSAQPGETIRLTYFIYSQDQSSSLFSDELLKASKRGVKVKLMADLITNYGLLDYFTYLQQESNGNIQVRLYGRPTPLMIRDIQFMTQPCPPTGATKVKATTCSDAKWAKIEGQAPDSFARLMLSGIYGKNLDALSTAAIKGQLIDLAALSKGAGTSSEDQKQFLDFLKLVYNAKVKHDLVAALKVGLAFQFYGDKLNPALNEITGKIPLSQKGEKSLQDWEHSTDFTHHKLLIVGNRFVQLGGRNIENSYHMKPNTLTDKYIFMDTDVAATLTGGGDAVVKSFDNLYNFKEMTISADEVRAAFPNDFVENSVAAKATLEKCAVKSYKTEADRYSLARCIAEELPRHPQYLDLGARLKNVANKMYDGVQSYNNQYLSRKAYTQTWKKGSTYSDEISSKDLSSLFLTYVENVPYDKRKNVEDRTRTYGAVSGQEMKYGKNIQYIWYKGLENACVSSLKEGKEKRIILHSAYFLPPAVMLKGFAKMMDGSWDCRYVKVTFLTNSPETTDLNYINVAAKYQMAAFFKIYKNRHDIYGSFSDNRSAKFEYFEYLKNHEAKGLSLHTKATVLGDDVLIGSANADVRSYYMDSNNGFFLRGAKDFVKDYVAFVDGITSDKTKSVELTSHFGNSNLTVESMISEDQKLVQGLLEKNEMTKKLSPKIKENLNKVISFLGKFIDTTTKKILSKEYIEAWAGDTDEKIDSDKRREQDQMEKNFNRMLQIL